MKLKKNAFENAMDPIFILKTKTGNQRFPTCSEKHAINIKKTFVFQHFQRENLIDKVRLGVFHGSIGSSQDQFYLQDAIIQPKIPI